MNSTPNVVEWGSHHFFSASPLNFWSNLSPEIIHSSIQDLASLNIGTIYLLVPWAEFVDDSGIQLEIQDYCRRGLSEIVKACNAHRMGIRIRLGYLWEARPAGTSTFERYTNFFSGGLHRESFQYFCRFLKEETEGANIRPQFFLSWEDLYWPIFHHWRALDREARLRVSRDSGFQDFLRLQCFDKTADIPVPEAMNELSVNFCQFVDTVVVPTFITLARRELGDVGYEYRVDSDHVQNTTLEGIDFPIYYHWARSHPMVNRKYIYFHQNFGGPREKTLTAQSAISNLKWAIRTAAPMHLHGEIPVTIDQFNFVDTTEKAWTQLCPDATAEFLYEAANLFEHQRIACALWSSIDWPRDIVFNGAFRLGLQGWTVGTSAAQLANGGVLLQAGDTLTQRLHLSLPDDAPVQIEIDYELEHGPASVTTNLGSDVREAEVSTERGTLRVAMPPFRSHDLCLRVNSGKVVITGVRALDRVYSQGGRTVEGRSNPGFDILKAIIKASS